MTVFILLIIFQIKHFLADYPLQTTYMLGKFKEKDWLLPLSSHSFCHSLFTIFISMSFTNNILVSLSCGIIDFILHSIMDRVKASPKMLGKYQALSKDQYKGLLESKALAVSGSKAIQLGQPLVDESNRLVKEIDAKFKSNVYFWYALGLDQMVHHLTHYLIIYIIVSNI